jgi:hypothetical protein
MRLRRVHSGAEGGALPWLRFDCGFLMVPISRKADIGSVRLSVLDWYGRDRAMGTQSTWECLEPTHALMHDLAAQGSVVI